MALAAWAVLAERAVIAVPVALAAVALPGLAAAVVLAWPRPAVLVAVAASAAMDSMPAVSPTAPLVVMPDKVALVAWAALLAHQAPTPRPWSVVLAASAVTPVSRALARRVSAA